MGRNAMTKSIFCLVITIIVLSYILLRTSVFHSTLLILRFTSKSSTLGSVVVHNSKTASSAAHLIPRDRSNSGLFNAVSPRLTPEEFRFSTWSSEPLVLRRRHRITILHNYTQYTDDEGLSRSRYTKREVIPHYKHIIPNHRGAFLPRNTFQNRGYTVNPAWPPNFQSLTSASKQHISWRWHNGPNTACPVRIPLCYADYDSYNKLRTYVPVAVSLWHDAFRNARYRGLEFKFIGEGSKSICPKLEEIGAKDANGNLKYPHVPRDTVWIYSDTSSIGCSATLGWIPGTEPARNNVRCDPSPGATGGLIRILAHELGHILGLNHEHQRPQASKEIDFHCEKIPGYQSAIAKLEDASKKFAGGPWTIEMICKDLALARKMRFAFTDLAKPFTYVDQIIPSASDKPASWMDSNGYLIDYVEIGESIDFESVMIYSSDYGGSDVMTKRGSGETWKSGQKPSKGDVEAVRFLYPDVV